MTSNIQKTTLGLALLLVVSAAGCGNDSKPPPDVGCVPNLSADVHARVDDKHGALVIDKKQIDGGSVRITVSVPTNATGEHGVAVDGGIYKNVEGAGVKPGKASSLTISLKPGKYTVYDPVGHNREKGYRSTLVVDKMAPAKTTENPCR